MTILSLFQRKNYNFRFLQVCVCFDIVIFASLFRGMLHQKWTPLLTWSFFFNFNWVSNSDYEHLSSGVIFESYLILCAEVIKDFLRMKPNRWYIESNDIYQMCQQKRKKKHISHINRIQNDLDNTLRVASQVLSNKSYFNQLYNWYAQRQTTFILLFWLIFDYIELTRCK